MENESIWKYGYENFMYNEAALTNDQITGLLDEILSWPDFKKDQKYAKTRKMRELIRARKK